MTKGDVFLEKELMMTLLMFLPSSDKLTMVSSHELQDQVL